MSGLGRLDRGQGGFGVADLADEDDIGVLADHMLERGRVRIGVEPDLALLNDRAIVVVHDLDRVLDRDDVRPARPVDVTDHRGDRRRLPGAGRSGEQHQATRGIGKLGDHRREQQLIDRRHVRAHPTDRKADHPPLTEHVHAEPADPRHRVAEVGLVRELELLALVLGHDRDRRTDGVVRGQGRERGRLEPAVHTDERHVAGLEVQIARTHLDRMSQQPRDVQGLDPSLSLGRLARLSGTALRLAPRLQDGPEPRLVLGLELGASVLASRLVVQLVLDLLELLTHLSARSDEL